MRRVLLGQLQAVGIGREWLGADARLQRAGHGRSISQTVVGKPGRPIGKLQAHQSGLVGIELHGPAAVCPAATEHYLQQPERRRTEGTRPELEEAHQRQTRCHASLVLYLKQTTTREKIEFYCEKPKGKKIGEMENESDIIKSNFVISITRPCYFPADISQCLHPYNYYKKEIRLSLFNILMAFLYFSPPTRLSL